MNFKVKKLLKTIKEVKQFSLNSIINNFLKNKYRFFIILSFVPVYILHLYLPKLLSVENYGYLKKILVWVSYTSILSFGSKDQYLQDIASKSKKDKGYFYFGIIGLLFSVLLLTVIIPERPREFYGTLFLILFLFLFTFYQYFEIYTTYAVDKLSSSKLKISKELLTLFFVVFFFFSFNIKDYKLWFLSIVISLIFTFIFYYKNLILFLRSIINEITPLRFPFKGFQIQITNLASQLSLSIDKLIGVVILSNTEYGMYAFIFIVPQAAIALGAQFGNFNYDIQFIKQTNNKKITTEIFLSLVIGVLTAIGIYVLSIIIDKYEVTIEKIILVSFCTVLNYFWSAYSQNYYRVNFKKRDVMLFVFLIFCVISLSFLFLKNSNDLLILFALLSILKFIYTLKIFVK